MSPLNSLRGRKKKEEGRKKTLEPWGRCQGRTKLHSSLYYCIIVNVVIMGGGGSICLPTRQPLLNYIVTPDLSLLCDCCQLFLVIKHGCFNDLWESVVQWQDSLPFP